MSNLSDDTADAFDFATIEKRALVWQRHARHIGKTQAMAYAYGAKTGRWNGGATWETVTANGNTRTHRDRYEQKLFAIIALSGGKVETKVRGWGDFGRRGLQYRITLPSRPEVVARSLRVALVGAVDLLKRGRSHLTPPQDVVCTMQGDRMYGGTYQENLSQRNGVDIHRMLIDEMQMQPRMLRDYHASEFFEAPDAANVTGAVPSTAVPTEE